MRSLTSLSLRSLRRRKGRYALTALGIGLGVAIAFAVLVTGRSTNEALDAVLSGFTGKADVVMGPVGAFDGTFPEDTVDEVRRSPGVAHALGVHEVRTAIQPPDDEDRGASLIFFLYGLDALDARPVHDFDLVEGRMYAADRNEIVVPRKFADVAEVSAGDLLWMSMPDGLRSARVVGIIEDDGAGLANGGLAAYSSPRTSRTLSGKLDVWSRIDVVLEEGIDTEEWIDEARRASGERFLITDASRLASGFRDFLGGVRNALALTGFLALFVGAFLIFLTFSLAVTERTRTYGTLRALGALPRQVRRVVLGEAAVLGVVGAVLGLAIGYVVALGALRLVSSLAGIPNSRVGVPVGEAVTSVLVGLAMSIGAALIPAQRAASLSPVAAMREEVRPEDRTTLLAARLVIFFAGVATVLFGRGLWLQAVGMLALVFGAVLLVPVVVRPAARALGIVTARFGRGVGDIAVMHLVKERSRSAYTLALVMVVLAATMATGGVNLSMQETLDEVVEEQFGADLQVQAAGAFDRGVGRELARVDGVRSMTSLRFGTTEILDAGEPRHTFVVVVDPESYFDVASFPWVEGDDDTARDALARGGAIVLGDPLADQLGLEVGDPLTIRTGKGLRRFEIAGTYAVMGFNNGIVVSDADGEALLGAADPMVYWLRLEPGTSADATKRFIERRLEGRYEATLVTAAEGKSFARSQLSGFFGMGYAIVLVSAIIGALGLANTLVVSILQRTREIGILRSTGVLRRQLWAMVLAEAATMVLVAFALSIPLGALLGWVAVRLSADSLGFTVAYVMPWVLLPVLFAVAVIVGLLASIGPARRAARLDPVVALRFD